jgi:hypothetical protein
MSEDEIDWQVDPRYPNRRVAWVKLRPGTCWHCGTSFQKQKALEQRLAIAEAKLRLMMELPDGEAIESPTDD